MERREKNKNKSRSESDYSDSENTTRKGRAQDKKNLSNDDSQDSYTDTGEEEVDYRVSGNDSVESLNAKRINDLRKKIRDKYGFEEEDIQDDDFDDEDENLEENNNNDKEKNSRDFIPLMEVLNRVQQNFLIEQLDQKILEKIKQDRTPKPSTCDYEELSLLEDLDKRIEYLQEYNKHLNDVASSMTKSYEYLKDHLLPEAYNAQICDINNSILDMSKKRDELIKAIPELEAELQVKRQECKLLNLQANAIQSLNEEMEEENKKLFTEFNNLQLAADIYDFTEKLCDYGEIVRKHLDLASYTAAHPNLYPPNETQNNMSLKELTQFLLNDRLSTSKSKKTLPKIDEESSSYTDDSNLDD